MTAAPVRDGRGHLASASPCWYGFQCSDDHLREKELAGALTAAEQPELAALMAEVEAEEAQALAPAMTRLRDDVEALIGEVRGVETRNEELARLLAQQQQLAADARRFLAEFDRRRATILDALARVAGGPLPAT